ncbi:ABC transporter permease, partial [Pseudokineococcus sp. 5B2Z-1]|uniref:ABC transporter permease n=1 Tax=Pseudokineococcus sp. 5B2Z-1 TaxID=3132744 RepID=UPI0030B7A18C
MLRFVVRRLALVVPVLLGLSVLLFAWLRALPGDPARTLLGERATPAAVERITEAYGFDRPLPAQYLTYLGKLLTGDLGTSSRTGEPVLESFLQRFPATVELAVAGGGGGG